jgi:predicted ATP-dependent endonuclease of OLD family
VAIQFDPPISDFIAARQARDVTVLAGRNNSGKSLILKHLKSHLGPTAYMVGAARFYHVYHFQSGLRNPNELFEFEQQFRNQFDQEQFNYEQNVLDLQRIITGLNDSVRQRLFDLSGELLDTTFELKKVEEDNELSVRYVDMGGQNLAVGSTGARLLMTILGICMDERFETVLIDEPELGLSPGVQASFARLLSASDRRREIFPHLQHVFLATHSHLFLSRREVQDNWVVSNEGETIRARPVESVSELHRLQFNLLGNSLEDLFLPSAIVIVEGKSDFKYIERVLRVRFPDRKVTVLSGQGNVKRVVHSLRDTFQGLQTSPFRDRIFVVVDAVHPAGLCGELVDMGVSEANVVQWSKNGIEYLYPAEILCDVFSCDVNRLADLRIADDRVSLGDMTLTKNELAERVAAAITADTELPDELTVGLLEKVASAIGP